MAEFIINAQRHMRRGFHAFGDGSGPNVLYDVDAVPLLPSSFELNRKYYHFVALVFALKYCLNEFKKLNRRRSPTCMGQ